MWLPQANEGCYQSQATRTQRDSAANLSLPKKPWPSHFPRRALDIADPPIAGTLWLELTAYRRRLFQGPTLPYHARCDGDAERRNPSHDYWHGKKSQKPARSVPYGIIAFALIDVMLYCGISKSRARIVMLWLSGLNQGLREQWRNLQGWIRYFPILRFLRPHDTMKHDQHILSWIVPSLRMASQPLLFCRVCTNLQHDKASHSVPWLELFWFGKLTVESFATWALECLRIQRTAYHYWF